MSQQAVTVLVDAPKDLHGANDYRQRLAMAILRLQNQATQLQSLFNGAFTGTITFGTGHSMTVRNGIITGYS